MPSGSILCTCTQTKHEQSFYNISLMFCVIFIFARITHVKVCSVKYSCSLVFSYKIEEGEEEGRNPVKFGCVVGGGRLRRSSRSKEEDLIK